MEVPGAVAAALVAVVGGEGVVGVDRRGSGVCVCSGDWPYK